MGPEPIEIGPERREAGWVYDIYATGAFRVIGDEAGLLEHTQVLGDGRPADRKIARQLTHGAWTLDQAFEDGASGGIAEGLPGTDFVSNH